MSALSMARRLLALLATPKPPDGGGAGKSATTVRASEAQAVRRG